MAVYFTIFTILIISYETNAFNCEEFTSTNNIHFDHVNWEILKNCLPTIGNELNIDDNIAANIWRLIKDSNNGIENIDNNVYKLMGNLIGKISIDDLQNITIDNIDLISVLGCAKGFTEQHLKLIVEKLRTEWSNKNPEKFSEYDLKYLNQILCYFNISEISRIHPDAYKGAANIIGDLMNCPSEIIKEFAKLAVHRNAFGPTYKWSKLDIVQVGNIISGLEPNQLAAINKEYLKVNQKIYNMTVVSGGNRNTSNSNEVVLKNIDINLKN